MVKTASRASRKAICFGIFNLAKPTVLYYVVLAVSSVVPSDLRTINSPFGEVLKAIRENEPRAISLGYKTDQYKLMAYIISGTIAGFAGSLKVFVGAERLAHRRALDDVGRNRADDAGRRSRNRIRPRGRRLCDHRHAGNIWPVSASG